MVWIIFGLACVLLSTVLIAPVRRCLLTKPFMSWFKASQPEITAAERDVLDAGNLWVEKEFFTAYPDLTKIIHTPASRLTDEEQQFLDQQVRTLRNMLDDWKITHEMNELPLDVWNYIKKERFWGMIIPKQYGGLEFSAYAHSQVITRIASKSISAALTVMVPNSLGSAEFLQHYGTIEQKAYYLPRLARGEEIACFALTAPNVGSDATGLTDKGLVCEELFEGKKTLGIRLNFDKRYITLAPISTLAGVAFKLYDPNHLLGEQENIGITLALVPTHLSGVTKGSRHNPMDLAFLNGPIRGKDVFIPIDYVIGGRVNVGKGWRMLMECLSIGRSISLPALATATVGVSYRMSSAYALLRQQFRRSIGEFEGIQLPLARIGGLTYLCEATRLLTLQGVDSGLRPAVASAIAKYHTTEIARQVINDAMDIHGGRGVQQGPRNYLANLYAAAPISITVEGANILTRCLIIYGQGALRCHPYLQHEIRAAMDNDVRAFDRYLMKHLCLLIRVKWGVLWRGLIPKEQSYEAAIQRFSMMFVLLSDTTMALVGKQLKFKESLSGRLGDILSYLYQATAVLKYFNNNGKLASEQLVMTWSLEYCLSKIEDSFIAILANYPKPCVAKFLKSWMMPWGRRYLGPKDQLSFDLATFMLTDEELRRRLTSACDIGDNASDPGYRIENAWQMMKQSQQSLNSDLLAKSIWDALQVDEFEGAF